LAGSGISGHPYRRKPIQNPRWDYGWRGYSSPNASGRGIQQPRETLTIRHDVEKLGDRRRPDAERWLERPFVDRDQSDHLDDAGGENDHGGDLGARLTAARLICAIKAIKRTHDHLSFLKIRAERQPIAARLPNPQGGAIGGRAPRCRRPKNRIARRFPTSRLVLLRPQERLRRSLCAAIPY
jgi:hypothetical protein